MPVSSVDIKTPKGEPVIKAIRQTRITDTIIILVVVIVNAIIGVAQESKAEKSLEALQKLSSHAAKVIRDGNILVVPARELNLKEIREMKDATGLEIECFVHGALCYCYSGQCLLSSMIGGRSGNRGQCAQPCRLPYSVNGKKPQDILSLKDLCTIDFLDKFIAENCSSLAGRIH